MILNIQAIESNQRKEAFNEDWAAYNEEEKSKRRRKER
jgi:hypothetical protein